MSSTHIQLNSNIFAETFPDVEAGDLIAIRFDGIWHPAYILRLPISLGGELRVAFFSGRLFCETSIFGNLSPQNVRKLAPGEQVVLTVQDSEI